MVFSQHRQDIHAALLAVMLLQERAPLYAHYAALRGPVAALADERDIEALMWIARDLPRDPS